ncbi:PspC domain-containing protein [Bifidobacterium sp. 64T4]|nr:PspC domain-containing protein [Bifidobacterium pongonis]
MNGRSGPEPEPANAAGQSYYQQPSYGSPRPARGGRFFSWIRSSRIVRGRDRWVGGVCDGLARCLGWSVTLVRALMLVTALFFGAGAAFYGLAWLLLPDENGNRILFEDLINGVWDWNCVGALIFCVMALCIPGAGWFAFALAALVLWLVVNRRSSVANNRQTQPGAARQAYGQPMPGQPAPGQFVPNQPASNQAMPNQPAPNQTMPVNPARQTQSGAAGENTPSGASPQSQYQPYQPPYQSPYQPYRQSMARPEAFATADVPPTFTAPVAARPQQPLPPRRERRKPAGPLLVLVMFGLALIACAVCAWCVMSYGMHDGLQPEYILRASAVCLGAICLATGLVIVVLGCLGRRTGGLHPLAWLSMFMVCVIAVGMVGYSVFDYRMIQVEQSYSRVKVDGTVTMGSTADEMRKYERGMAVYGNSYATDVLHIDLSQYAKNNGSHKVKLNDGTYGTSSCPVGALNLVVVNAQVVLTLPDGCWWSFGNTAVDGSYTITDFVGGPNQISFRNGEGMVSLFGGAEAGSVVGRRALSSSGFKTCPAGADGDDGDDGDAGDVGDDSDRSTPFKSSDIDKGYREITNNRQYWPCFVDDGKAPALPELQANVGATVGGSVAVQYASDNTLGNAAVRKGTK